MRTVLEHEAGCRHEIKLRPANVRKYCRPSEPGNAFIRTAMAQLPLSARAVHRVLKLAHTIANLASSGPIQPAHLAEAIHYRPRRQNYSILLARARYARTKEPGVLVPASGSFTRIAPVG